MQIASVGQSLNAAAPQRMPEAAEGAGPDRDGDKDDARVSATKSSLAQGVGSLVDTTA